MMNEEELVTLLQADLDQTDSTSSGELSDRRAKSMRYYLGEPMGNEKPGRSQIVSSEVSDTIEWILPQLLKIFGSGDEVVLLDPVGPEDEEQAKQETDYLNYIFFKENDGFEVLYTWFKDALLSINGIVKYYYEDGGASEPESYMGLTPEEVQALLMDDHVEVVEYSENEDGTSDIKIVRKKDGRVVIENIPPEDFRIHTEFGYRDIQKASFCAHESVKTLSWLREHGYPEDLIDQIVGYYHEDELNEPEYLARFDQVSSTLGIERGENQYDKSMTPVKITECIKRVDYDNDGIAEIRKIVLANETLVLENEEIGYVPYEAITPVPMTHRFFGRSVAELVLELQELKTQLWRNIIDNFYLVNNQRYLYLEGEADLDMLLDGRPGAATAVTRPDAVTPLVTQPFNGQAYSMLEYVDSQRENRTGVTRYSQGMDGDSLNKTATGIDKIMTASQERVNLIARIFGNGLKRLMLGLHRLALQHMDKQKLIRLRGNWVPVNPAEWRERENMTVTVGLGTGDKEKQKESMLMLMQMQKGMMEIFGPQAVSPAHYAYTLSKFIEAAGYQDKGQYYTNPEQIQWPPQPAPDPQQMMIQAQMQVEQMKAQIEQMKIQQDGQIEVQKLALSEREVAMKAQSEERKAALNEYKTRMQVQLNNMKHRLSQAEALTDKLEGNDKLAMQKYIADLNSDTQILLKQMDMSNQSANQPT